MPSSLRFTGNEDADDLLNSNSLALLIGMLLDQQFPIERAFRAPLLLQERLGRNLDATSLAQISPGDLIELFAQKPALHRFPKSMAAKTHSLCVYLVERYEGNPNDLWTGVSDASVLRERLLSLPGFGEKKVAIFIALLAKRFGVTPQGWESVSGVYSTSGFHSVADLNSPQALTHLREQRSAEKRKK